MITNETIRSNGARSEIAEFKPGDTVRKSATGSSRATGSGYRTSRASVCSAEARA